MWESVQNLNWAADWLHPCQQGINDVTANLIGATEELHCMRLKTGFDVNNKQFGKTILSSFRSAAQQSLAKMRKLYANICQLNQVGRGRSFVWIYPAKGCSLNKCDDFLLCVLCHAGTISALLFAQSWILRNSALGAGFFLSFLIFYSLWRGLFATKSATNNILLGIAILSGNFSLTGTVIPLLQTGNS